MRTRIFRVAAAILGILGVPSLIWQVSSGWPLDQVGMYFYAGQAVVLYAFLSYGLGIGTLAPHRLVGKPATPDSSEWTQP